MDSPDQPEKKGQEDPEAWSLRTLREHILIMGIRDDIDAAWAIELAKGTLASPELSARRKLKLGRTEDPGVGLARNLVVGTLLELAVRGEIQIGDLTPSGFQAWPLSPGAAVERIMREWLDGWSESIPDDYEIFVARTTERGDQEAKATLAAESEAGLWD